MVARHRGQLPDLSQHAVLLPSAAPAPRLRQLLLNAAAHDGVDALLLPWIGPFNAWLARFPTSKQRILNDTARELMLVEAIANYPRIRARYGTWPLAESLGALFDELTHAQCRLPATVDEFRRLLISAYGTESAVPALDNEAELVHTLWGAWQHTLAENRWLDAATARHVSLGISLQTLARATHIYVAGFIDFSPAETTWLATLCERSQLTLVLHGDARGAGYHPDGPIARVLANLGQTPATRAPDAFADFLDQAYSQNEVSMAMRARAFARTHRCTPVRGRLAIFSAPTAEDEARAVDLQVRRMRLQGAHRIGVVTNDRKLARRVRALLERAQLQVSDAAGWALSTTSAATALTRWLECVQRGFPHAPLLDFLHSPFVTLGGERTQLKSMVLLFEELVVRRQNVASGLDAYRAATVRGVAALEQRHAGAQATIIRMLGQIETAAKPPRALVRGEPRRLSEYLDAVRTSLVALGVWDSYAGDTAGLQLVEAIEELRAATGESTVALTWEEFRFWLDSSLDRRRFRPTPTSEGVDLMSLAESRLCSFDAVVIAGCTANHLPGALPAPPFFNDGVRQRLGLPPLADRYAQLLHDFRRLLESAPTVLVSYRREDAREALHPSPWVERLRAFHMFAYDDELEDVSLHQLLAHPDTLLAARTAPPTAQPSPAARLPATLLPVTLSAGAHQRLLDCPYQFFAMHGLGLVPTDDVTYEMEKSDYGQYVHRILHAFHTGVPGLPGPWIGAVTPAAHSDAERLLEEISQVVFAPALTRHFSARGWWYRWQALIPAYVAWQAARGDTWHTVATEEKREHTLEIGGRNIALTGRIDRLDQSPAGYSLIDYKTGNTPKLDAVASGEQAQLLFYAALLDNPVTEALYLRLDDDTLPTTRADGEQLTELIRVCRERLVTVLTAVAASAPLPAWGDRQTCAYCEVEGICRKEMWHDNSIES